MIAKIVKGQGFKGVVNYILDQSKGTEVIDNNGVRLKSQETIIQSFISQLELNPALGCNLSPDRPPFPGAGHAPLGRRPDGGAR
jgi:hypothetical protein